MRTVFDIWAPMFRAPFSGDVIQDIEPRIFSPDIKGVPEIEFKVETEVASAGKQLGKILEALQALAAKTGVDLGEIDTLVKEINAVKADCKDALRSEAEDALRRLRKADADSYTTMIKSL